MQEDRATRMQQRVLEVIMQEISGWVNNVLHGMLNPAKIMELVRAIGIDISQLPGMVSGQTGFDPYQLLGLDRSASDEEVKKRYRQLLHRLHPDTSGTEGTAFLLQLVIAAYDLIKKQREWRQ